MCAETWAGGFSRFKSLTALGTACLWRRLGKPGQQWGECRLPCAQLWARPGGRGRP